MTPRMVSSSKNNTTRENIDEPMMRSRPEHDDEDDGDDGDVGIYVVGEWTAHEESDRTIVCIHDGTVRWYHDVRLLDGDGLDEIGRGIEFTSSGTCDSTGVRGIDGVGTVTSISDSVMVGSGSLVRDILGIT